MECPPELSNCSLGIIPINPRAFTADQQALQQLVKEASNGGKTPISRQTFETIREWATESNYPGFRASPNDLAGAHGQAGPHFHLPGSGSHATPIKP